MIQSHPMKSWQLYKRNMSILNISQPSHIMQTRFPHYKGIITNRALNLPLGCGNIRKRDKRIRAGIAAAITWAALVGLGYAVCFCIGG